MASRPFSGVLVGGATWLLPKEVLECMVDNVQPPTHIITEGYEEPRTRARRWELIDWYLRSMIGGSIILRPKL